MRIYLVNPRNLASWCASSVGGALGGGGAFLLAFWGMPRASAAAYVGF
jgi:hypothetical protein